MLNSYTLPIYQLARIDLATHKHQSPRWQEVTRPLDLRYFVFYYVDGAQCFEKML
jgi:hypothetical protein